MAWIIQITYDSERLEKVAFMLVHATEKYILLDQLSQKLPLV